MCENSIRSREWSKLPFYDPEGVLRKVMSRPDLGFIPEDQRPNWKPLRGSTLNQERQWLDAAVFTYGLCQMLGLDARMARFGTEDFDFLVTWTNDETCHNCPVQLKELVPEHINRGPELSSIISGLARLGKSGDTMLAIKLNRAGKFDSTTLKIPPLPFSQVWLFGSISPDLVDWFLYGDCLGDARCLRFRLPS